MADYEPEVPDAARHRPAYFKDLSGFIASQDGKLVQPNRALNRHRNLGRSLELE